MAVLRVLLPLLFQLFSRQLRHLVFQCNLIGKSSLQSHQANHHLLNLLCYLFGFQSSVNAHFQSSSTCNGKCLGDVKYEFCPCEPLSNFLCDGKRFLDNLSKPAVYIRILLSYLFYYLVNTFLLNHSFDDLSIYTFLLLISIRSSTLNSL